MKKSSDVLHSLMTPCYWELQSTVTITELMEIIILMFMLFL